MNSEEPKVHIGLREVYDAVMELKGIVSGHPDKLDDHERRIRSLEAKVWFVGGIFGTISFIIGQLMP
jgi:hypothetical protein